MGLTVPLIAATFNFMVEHESPRLNMVFNALGDATRRRMIRALAGGEQTVTQLAKPFAMSLAAASKHVRTLERAGLISRDVQGRTHVCRLQAQPLAEADAWLRIYERFWSTHLDLLEAALRDEDARSSQPLQGE